MDDKERYIELDKIFRSSDYLNRSSEDLQKDLQVLCTVVNKNTESRDVIRALTINNIQMSRLINEINSQNSKLQKWFLAIAGITVLVGLLGVIF